MSGHSKWSTIKRKKGAIDAKRGKVFSKLIKEITIAARMGGADQGINPRLRAAVITAKSNNMPNDNIERAIKKGSGSDDTVTFEEVTYEGYGAGGVAIIVETQTDNRNRTTADVRHVFAKYAGNMGTSNCVAFMFQRKGEIVFDADEYSEDRVTEVALELGADDVVTDQGTVVVTCDWTSFADVVDAFEQRGLKPASAEINQVPDTTIKLTGKEAEQVLRLVDRLEDLDDVQKVYANFDIDEAEFEQLSE